MRMYLNTATNLLKSRMFWVLTLPRALLGSGETWDSLIDELVMMGLFVEVEGNQDPDVVPHEHKNEKTLGIADFDSSSAPTNPMGEIYE